MHGIKLAAVVTALLALGVTGCQNSVKKQNDALWAQNREAQARLSSSEAEKQALAAENQRLQAENQRLQSEAASLQASLRTQTTAGPEEPGLEGIDAVYDAKAGTVTVTLPGDVLFASGSADLKPTAMATLDKIIKAVKKDYASKKVLVRGHTDTDPIRKTRDKWTDNWDLGFARAHAVQQYLVKNGIDEKNISDVASAGPNTPKGSKAASRRVEIVVSTR
ncbi:MAG: OmpA family protein [Phycisphaerales bacterium]|nr:OmpA family protein [Phycisphaerales bacterium]